MEKMRSPADVDENSASKETVKNELFSEIISYKERENDFLNSLYETINLSDSEQARKDNENQCNSYIHPLLDRTSNTISTLITTKNAIDQLDSLHHIVNQLLAIQERNFHLRQSIKTVQTLKAIKINTTNIQKNPEIITQIFEENSDDEMDLEQNLADLEAVLMASKSVSDKRNGWKQRRRSKSVIIDDPMTYKDDSKDTSHKTLSKWRKVKAAFKWEKTRALHEAKGFEELYETNDYEPTESLRYPSGAYNQDRVLSNSSAISMFSDSSKDETTKDDNSNDERRIRLGSLDSDVLLDFGIIQNFEKRKNKSAWKKVKDLVKPNRSPVRLMSKVEYPSREISPSESYNTNPRNILPFNSLTTHYLGNYLIPMIDADGAFSSISSDDASKFDNCEYSKKSLSNYSSADSDHYKESGGRIKNLPSPLNIQKNYVDRVNLLSPSCNQIKSPLHKLKTTSVPNSPSKSSDFFNEEDFFERSQNSEPVTPSIKSRYGRQRDEIFKKYQDLQSEISKEFNMKIFEWDKLRPMVEVLNNSVNSKLLNDELEYNKSPNGKMAMSSDFQKKYDEWQIKKSQKPLKGGSLKFNSPSSYKTSELQTKTLKFDESSCKIPDPKDLPSDFQKKLTEWKQMKSENRSSLKYTVNRSGSFKRSSKSSKNSLFNHSIRKLKSYDSVDSIQQPKGSIKNEGISQKFSRKLYEWEETKGFKQVEKTPEIEIENMEDDELGAVIVEVEDEMPEISLTLSLEQNELNDSYSNMEIIINELVANLNHLIDEETSEMEDFTGYILSTFKLILDILNNFDFPKMNIHIRKQLNNAIEITNTVYLKANETDILMEQKEIKDQAECIKSIMLNVLNILRKDLSQNASIHQASASVQKLYSNVATVSMVQSFVCNPITISKIQNSTCGSASCSDIETMPNYNEPIEPIKDPVTMKICRNNSNVSKRRQNIERNRSKTESDSENELFTAETSRRLKRKSSKNRKHGKSIESLSTEELVYVFKIKPGESQSQTIETMKPNKVLISPTETSVSILNNSQEHLQLTSSNINCSNAIIKTQRMLFVPVADNDEEQNVRVSLKDETETNEIPESIKSVGNAMENITQKTESSSERVDIVVKQFEEFSAPKLAKLKLLRYARPISRSFQDFNVLQYSWKENIRNRSLSESTIKMIKVANIDLPAERKMPDNDTEKIYTGAIPKILSKLQEKKKWNSFTIRKLDLIDDGTKYLSQRAKKIREAKEAFFSSSPDSSQPIYEKNDIEIDSVCVTPMDQNEFPELNLSIASNISNISRTTALSKNPRFGFTSITSSIRKVINKNHKNSTKMNSVTELCKQTLYLDITGITKSESINFNPSK